jgi:hypothetical protein
MTTTFFMKLLDAKRLENSDPRIGYQPKEPPKNIYDAFIEYLKIRKLDLSDPNLVLEKHHVIPLHISKIARNSPEDKTQEVIEVTYEEHYSAHLFSYLVYGLPGDFLFLQLRSNQGAEKARLARQLGGKIAGKLNTPAQQAQRHKNLKLHPENLNPSKAGSVGSPAQKAHSAKIGKMYGRQAGISRQDPVTKDQIQKPTRWVHKSGVEVFISKAETVLEIMEILNSHVSGNVKFTSGLSSLLRKVEKRRYGWILVDNEE